MLEKISKIHSTSDILKQFNRSDKLTVKPNEKNQEKIRSDSKDVVTVSYFKVFFLLQMFLKLREKRRRRSCLHWLIFEKSSSVKSKCLFFAPSFEYCSTRFEIIFPSNWNVFSQFFVTTENVAKIFWKIQMI